jgi:2-dehydropantoate 2-reductase
MKTLIFGAGLLGSLYACLLHRAGNDITILARNEHFTFLNENGVVLINEFTQEKIIEKVNVVNSLSEEDSYDLIIILMRKNSLKNVLPILNEQTNISNFLFMGNNTLGFDEYLKFLPKEKVLFGFPGGGGSRINHVVHYVDSEKPNGKRMSITIGEIDGKIRERTQKIQRMFESASVPVKIVDDIDSWLKYHVAFINPIAGALLKSGDNYKLSMDMETIRTYIRAVNEGSKVLKALGYKKSYNVKLRLFYWLPESVVVNILKQVFNSKFAEVAMMMHVNAAKDEMIELGNEFKTLENQTSLKTPNLDELMASISYNIGDVS